MKFSYFVDQCCEMSLHDPVCLVVMHGPSQRNHRENIYSILAFNVQCILYKRHNSHLGNCYFRIVNCKKKKKLCILHCSLLSVELRNEVFHVNLMPWDKFGEKYENALILHSITCCSLLQSNLV